MIELEIGGQAVKAVYSVWTCMLYEQEFDGANMLSDLFGVMKFEAPAEEPAEPAAEPVTIDFTGEDWNAVMRAAWAGIKAADDKTPPFKEWARSATDMNMFDVSNAVHAEAMRRCFRTGVDASE